jgi:hypothetical protein
MSLAVVMLWPSTSSGLAQSGVTGRVILFYRGGWSSSDEANLDAASWIALPAHRGPLGVMRAILKTPGTPFV